MSRRDRKPLPQPVNLGALNEKQITEKYFLPFVIAEAPRMMLMFLANSSGLPLRYREMIATWTGAYNEELTEYLHDTYGEAESADLNRLSQALYARFINAIHEERVTEDGAMLADLDKEIFGDG